jgi:hypothetical protein
MRHFLARRGPVVPNGLMKNIFLSLTLALAFVTTGCATMSKEDCAKADWQHIGSVDGQMGKDAPYFEQHRELCGLGKKEAEAYEKGRTEGLARYCTAGTAYREGAQGRSLADVCPEALKNEMSLQHQQGALTYQLASERSQVKREIESKREKIQKDKSFVGDVSKVYHLLTNTSATAGEEARVQKLNEQIRERDARAPAGGVSGLSLQEQMAERPFSVFRQTLAIGGGLVFGFGVGHSIQGTYKRQGWKWTAIDAANILGLMVASSNCNTTDPETHVSQTRPTGACVGSTLALASGLFVSRIWQAIEIGKNSAREYSPYNVGIQPVDGGGSLVANWLW